MTARADYLPESSRYDHKRIGVLIGIVSSIVLVLLSYYFGLHHLFDAWDFGDVLFGATLGFLYYSVEQLHRLRRDPTTKLYRRVVVEEKLAVCAARRKDITIALIDINGLKKINDTLGHDTGDHLLQEMGRRLHSFKKTNRKVMVARLGGDEFVVISPKTEASKLRHQLDHLFKASHDFGSFPLAVAGVARTRNGHRDVLKCADLAMYRAKDAYYKTGHSIVLSYDIILDGRPNVPTPVVLRRKRGGSNNADTAEAARTITAQVNETQGNYLRVMKQVKEDRVIRSLS